MNHSKPPALKAGTASPHQRGEDPTDEAGPTRPRIERRVAERRHISDFRHREFRLRVVARVTGTGVYDFDFATGTNYWSPELKAIAGLPDDSSDISLEQMAELAYPEDIERFVQQFEASLLPQGDGHFEGEYRIVRPDGALRWVRVRGRAFFAGDGRERRILGASGIVIDITEQRNSLEELRIFKFFSDHSSESNLVMDSEGRIRYANRQLCQRLGYSEEEMLRLHLQDISLNFDFRRMFSELVERSREGGMLPFESVRRCRDGSTYPVEISATALETQGEWLVFLVSRDITERKLAEQALRDNERRLAMALEASATAVWELDVASGTLRGDDRIFTMLGYAPGELANREDWESRIHEDDREGVLKDLDAVIQGQQMNYRRELRIRTKGGSWRWIASHIMAAERDEKGRALRLVGTHTDITERKTAEAQIQALNAELEARVKERTAQLQESNEALLQSNTELRHFAHATAHDLQTPLRSIAGFTQLLQQEVQGLGNEQFNEWSAAVVENTRRLQLLIRDILSYTRLETQGRPFEMTDLGQLFDEVATSLSTLIGESGAEVTCGALPALPVDRTQIAQVLQNLIENGIKYNRSTPPRVAVAGELQEDQWVFSVADNGIGIDPKHFDRIFALFQRLHPYHRFPGAGIGLALCRRIIERHGGHIWVESRPGEGSTFYFSLPVERVEGA